MKIETQLHSNVIALQPDGPLSGEDVAEMRKAMETAAAQRAGRVVIDMSNVPFVDSGGIEALLECCTSSSHPAQPCLARVGDTCREALDLTDVLGRLHIFDTLDNAIRSFKR